MSPSLVESLPLGHLSTLGLTLLLLIGMLLFWAYKIVALMKGKDNE